MHNGSYSVEFYDSHWSIRIVKKANGHWSMRIKKKKNKEKLKSLGQGKHQSFL